MADYLDDDDLLSGDYRKKDDILDEDLDENELLYGSEDEEEFLSNSPEDPICEINEIPVEQLDQSPEDVITEEKSDIPESKSITEDEFEEKGVKRANSEIVQENNSIDAENLIENEKVPSKKIKTCSISLTESELDNDTQLLQENDEDVDAGVLDGDEHFDDDDLEESEDEDGRAGRFKSERALKPGSNAARTEPSDKRDIPDTLELSEEAQKKLDNFEEKERRGWRGRGRGGQRGRGQGMRGRGQHQNRPRNFDNGKHFQQQNFNRGRIQQFQHFSRPIMRQAPPVIIQPRPPLFGGLGILGAPPDISKQIRHNPLVSPPNLQLNLTSQNPPQYTPFNPSVPPPPFPNTIPLSLTQAMVSSIPPPVLTNTVVNPHVLINSNGNGGAPIPTLMSTANQRVGDREVAFSNDIEDSQLSVKITSAPRSPRSLSRSRSRSHSPIHRHRKKSRRRRRSPSSRKRSRRRSRSYSPDYRRPKASIAEQLQQEANKKVGKIHINPHFKGVRSIPSSTAAAAPQLPKIPFPPPGFPPPTIPPSNLLIPPPKNPPLNIPQSHVPPPNMSVPPPRLPIPPNITVPPPRLLPPPPPAGKTQQGHPQVPLPIRGSLLANRPSPIAGLIIQGGQRAGAPPQIPNNNAREQQGRGGVVNTNLPRTRQPNNQRNRSNFSQRPTRNERNTQPRTSRIKPPPNIIAQQTSKSQIWKETGEDAKYQELLRQQSEQRKLVFANKTRKNNNAKAGQQNKTAVADGAIQKVIERNNSTLTVQGKSTQVTVSNVSLATKPEDIKRLMDSIGPVKNFRFDEAGKIFVGNFNDKQQAERFMEKYNRHMVDLSVISVSIGM